MRRLGSPFALLAALAAVLLPAASASGLSYPVTSKADSGDKGTLRGSIEEANAHSGADSIPIEVMGTILLENPLPGIAEGLAIVGPGPASLTIRRAVLAESFGIVSVTSGNVWIEGVKISEGDNGLGGGVHNGPGSLTLTRVAVVGNESSAAHLLDAPAHGGGIYSEGPLTLRESVVSGNRAVTKGAGETDAEGGGIFALGELTVDRSTISGNAVDTTGASGPVSSLGGGIFAEGGGLVSGSTVAGNSASGAATSGSNLHLPTGLVVRDTIVAEPLGGAASCAGALLSGGFNLDEDKSCGFGESSDLVGVAAGLEPLADNGGATPTRALSPGSAAIDRGDSFGSSFDQRGLPRPSDFPGISNAEGGDGSDIGAFELQAPTTADGGGPVLVSEVPSDRRPPDTRIIQGPARDSYQREAKFRFASTEAQSSFQCKVDKGRWKGCRNPYKRTVKPGKHVFKVRAIDRFGNVDPTPARFGWRVKPLS